MVCNPVVQRDGKFVIDALFNMGYSGGPVLATRREGDGFEWIGMALSSAGESLSVLVPEESFGLSDSEDYPASLEHIASTGFSTDSATSSAQRRLPGFFGNTGPLAAKRF
jgi:hypothetical protein